MLYGQNTPSCDPLILLQISLLTVKLRLVLRFMHVTHFLSAYVYMLLHKCKLFFCCNARHRSLHSFLDFSILIKVKCYQFRGEIIRWAWRGAFKVLFRFIRFTYSLRQSNSSKCVGTVKCLWSFSILFPSFHQISKIPAFYGS